MTRRRWWFVLGAISAVGALICGIALALWYTPAFYIETREADSQVVVREQQAKEFAQRATQLDGAIRNDEQWSGEFSQDQINGFLAHELPLKFSEWLPTKMSDPRVRLTAGEIDIAFRYQRGWWRGTVHAQVRPHVLSPRQLALEIKTIRAGAIPIPAAQPLDEIVSEMRKAGWQVQWRPAKDGELLVIDLRPEVASQVSLDGLDIQPGVLRFAGHKPHAVARQSPPATGVTPMASKPAARARK